MTDLTVVTNDEPQPERSLSRLMPRNVKELAFFGNQAAASGLFKTSAGRGQGMRNITGTEAFLLMSQGVELGLSPLQSLRELNIIDGRVDVPASVRAALISASPKVTQWDANATPDECTITAKRSDRTTVCSVTVRKSDMNAQDVQRHKDHMDDWLYARAVRKISRRYFPDFALGLGTSSEESYDPEKIIDVGRVEQAIDVSHQAAPYGHHEDCGGILELQANTRTGGAFLRCPKCNATFPPPQEVRDVIRGEPVSLTIAAPDLGSTSNSNLPTEVPTSTHLDEPSPDEPASAAENGGGSLPPETHTLDGAAAGDSAAPPSDTPDPAAVTPTPAAVVLPEPEPAAAVPSASDSGSPATIDATPADVAADAPEAASAPLSPRDALRAFLRTNRAARGPLHVAIRDALLDAGWDGTIGISQLCDEMSDANVAMLTERFASPGFGTVQ